MDWKRQKVIISLMGWEPGYHQFYHDSKGGHLTGVKAPFCSFFLWFLFIITLLSLQRRAADRSTSPLHQLSHCATRKPLSHSVIYNLHNFTMSLWLSNYSRWEVQCILKRTTAQCVLCKVRCHCIFSGPGIRYSDIFCHNQIALCASTDWPSRDCACTCSGYSGIFC